MLHLVLIHEDLMMCGRREEAREFMLRLQLKEPYTFKTKIFLGLDLCSFIDRKNF